MQTSLHANMPQGQLLLRDSRYEGHCCGSTVVAMIAVSMQHSINEWRSVGWFNRMLALQATRVICVEQHGVRMLS